ncbi:MAG: RNA 2',3'-cyclic phosphodiesterase [Candidatus Aenigmatarchaeota archaeon]
MVRCFVGILVPEKLRQNIKKIMEEIKKLPIRCKFVEEYNLHICLSFLGETKENEVEKIKNGLDTLSSTFKPFEVFVEGIKLIPNERFLRVIALDVKDENEKIESLRKMVLKQIGGDSKPPHITLCRVKAIEEREFVIKKIKEMSNLRVGAMKIDRIQLIKSELNRAGPTYSIIHEVTL